jgi:heme-binding NEAT domain protein
MDAHIVIDTGRPGPYGIMTHNIRLKFDTDALSVVKEPTTSKKQLYQDGSYALPVEVMKSDANEQSSMQKNVQESSVTIKDGKATVTITFNQSNFITDFLTNREGKLVDASVVGEDEVNETRSYSFPVRNLEQLLDAHIVIDTGRPGPYGIMKHDIRLKFDTSKLPLVKGNEPPAEKPIENPKKSEKKNPTIKHGTYKDIVKHPIPVVIYKEYGSLTKDNFSSMNGYIEEGSYVTIENGKATVTVLMNSSNLIKDFMTNQNGRLVTTKRNDLAGDISEFTFPVKNLDALLDAHIVVDISAYGLGIMKHDIRLAFDTSKLVLEEGQARPVNVLTNTDNYDGPGFDRDADVTKIESEKQTENLNPKTADSNMTKVIFFALLLLASLIPLAIKLRNRFVTNE